MEARHIFMKGLNGCGIFYRSEDLIVLITIVSTLVRKMRLTVLAFCPMFNHIHITFKNIGNLTLKSFIQRLAVTFVREYNEEYGRKGPLFNKQFGSSIKKTVKIIMGNIAYVFNNPVAGKLCRSAKEYRWNLLAYRNCPNPFSQPLRKRTCRTVVRRAMDKVEYFHSKCKHISYPVLNGIFADLTKEEKQQVTDYILYKYNFLSYESLENLFGSFEKMCLAVDSNAGSEFDIEEEYGDHSCYRAMLSIVRDLGFTGKKLNFELLTKNESDKLYNIILKSTHVSPTCINKFLHRPSANH